MRKTIQDYQGWTLLEVECPMAQTVWANPEVVGQVFVAGDKGTILRSDDAGESWRRQETGTDVWLRSLTGHAGQVFAVGRDGVVLRSDDGEVWRSLDPLDESGEALWCDDDRVVVVGSQGAIFQAADGETFARRESHVAHLLSGIVGFGERLFVVGTGGTILSSEDGGETWTVQRRKGEVFLYGIWGSSPEHLVAAGSGGSLLVTSDRGRKWGFRRTGIKDAYYYAGAWGTTDGEVFAAGGRKNQACIVESGDGGRRWSPVNLPPGAGELTGISAASGGAVYAVGWGGTFLRRL